MRGQHSTGTRALGSAVADQRQGRYVVQTL